MESPSSGSSGRVREGGRETWNLCSRLRWPSFLWLIFTGPRGPCPPGPVKISHKKDGHRRRLHRFHVSRPPSLPGRWIHYWDSPFYIQTQYRLDRSCSVKAVVWLKTPRIPVLFTKPSAELFPTSTAPNHSTEIVSIKGMEWLGAVEVGNSSADGLVNSTGILEFLVTQLP